MKLLITEARIENMINHLYANDIEARWWEDKGILSTYNTFYVEIQKDNMLEKSDYINWIRTWFPKTIIVSNTDTHIEFILGV